MREQPLVLGAIGVALGAMFAASLPRTRQEDRLMGGARDRLVDEARDAAADELERASPRRGNASASSASGVESYPDNPLEGSGERAVSGSALSDVPEMRVPPGELASPRT